MEGNCEFGFGFLLNPSLSPSSSHQSIIQSNPIHSSIKINSSIQTPIMSKTQSSINPKSGFCSATAIFHSLRPPLSLPPLSTPLTVTQYAFSLLHSFPPPPTSPAFIDVLTGRQISFPDLLLRTKNLASSLRHRFGLRKGDVALVLAPNSIQVPVLYLSLFSIGVVIAPSNPASSIPEILHQIRLSKPVIAFATSATSDKVPTNIETILLDSPDFETLTTDPIQTGREPQPDPVYQSDPAAILYSSGTTGKVKGVLLTQRCFVYSVAVGQAVRAARETPPLNLCTVPYFHVYGLSYCVRSAAMGETVVTLGRFEFGAMLRAIEEYRVTHMAVAPPIVVAMAKDTSTVGGYNLSSLEVVSCGGAALRNSVIGRFKQRFPYVQLAQAYGLTETTARIFGTLGPKESKVIGATGKLMSSCQAMIVDPETAKPLPPCTPGELWVRGPAVMKGYVDDEEATASAHTPEGWFKTGDLCYIDNEGFLFFVDRLKELIKCKGYQVAPAELEHLLQSHQDIADAAVVPYPDEDAGQVPIAFVVRHKGSNIDESSIKHFVSKQVAPYKRLQRVIFIDSLPKNATGKVLRRELAKLAISSSAVSKL